MVAEYQKDVVAFLKRELAVGAAGASAPECVETHISRVFLSGDLAFKLKRPVKLPYLDFTTPELRLAACRHELELNRRTAPKLYQRVRAITQAGNGALEWDGDGQLADAVVEMSRFGQDALFDKMAIEHRLTPAIMTGLAHVIARFHASAEPKADVDAVALMGDVLDINDRSLRRTGLVSDADAGACAQSFRQALETHASLLAARGTSGKIRLCHGDLHLRNICLIDGEPVLFDCIEFNDGLATVDVLYDLAFLLMDLWHRDLRDLANLVLNRYLDEAGESGGLGLIPFFMAVRAAVRAHVMGARLATCPPETAADVRHEAKSYFDLALALLLTADARLVAIGGFSGSGKTTVAAAVAAAVGAPPGARVLNSDRIRKRMHGCPPGERLPAAAYRPVVSQAVYREMQMLAFQALKLGVSVIVDAVFDREPDRDAIRRIAETTGATFLGIWLETPAPVLQRRVAARIGGPSDATGDVLLMQLKHGCGELDWEMIPTDGGLDTTVEQVKRIAGA